MKRFWRKILFYVLAIWAVSMAYATISTTREKSRIRFDEGPGMFEQLWETVDFSSGPKIKARSAVLVDLDTGEVLAGKNENSRRPIASLTKLATAMVFLNTGTDLLKEETVTEEDRRGAGRTRLFAGAGLTLYDLFHLMLISSDNVAARILARSTGLSREEFVAEMNKLAGDLGLKNTKFADPTGLDYRNVSTASEMARLFREALSHDRIAAAISKKNYEYRIGKGRRKYIAYNTNRLLYGRHDVIGGKTGHIRASGYCLALGIEDSDGRKFGVVILGAPSNNYRYRDAHRLLASVEN
jgi:D-alanyl-D-alanine endopeptidase (penicillin-binding protein 7)